MANYVCTNRTNYFRVTDAEAFKNFLSQVVTDTDEDLYVWEKETGDETYYAFDCYSNIFGIPDDTVKQMWILLIALSMDCKSM